MTAEQKRLWWRKRNLALFAWLLNDMPKEICDWRMCQTFWQSPALQQEPERESPKQKRLLSSQIHFTSVYSNMVVKSTKESTSQSFDCLCERERNKTVGHFTKVRATSYRLSRPSN